MGHVELDNGLIALIGIGFPGGKSGRRQAKPLLRLCWTCPPTSNSGIRRVREQMTGRTLRISN